MRLELEINAEIEDMKRYQEIFLALLSSGGLSGVKNGRTILHFDPQGSFAGIELQYWPWRKRKDLTDQK